MTARPGGRRVVVIFVGVGRIRLGAEIHHVHHWLWCREGCAGSNLTRLEVGRGMQMGLVWPVGSGSSIR